MPQLWLRECMCFKGFGHANGGKENETSLSELGLALYFTLSEGHLAGEEKGPGGFGSPGERGQPSYDFLQKGKGMLS